MNLYVAMLLLCLATVVSSAPVDDAATHFGRQASNRPDDVATVPNGQQLETLLGNITDFRLDRLAMRPPGRRRALSVIANDASARAANASLGLHKALGSQYSTALRESISLEVTCIECK